jgi:hypothetical protein
MTGKFEAGGRLTNFLSMTPNWDSGMETGGSMQNMHWTVYKDVGELSYCHYKNVSEVYLH